MVELINAVAFLVFTIALAAGAGATLARVIRYSVHGIPRPRLLTRDVQVIGGLALTMGTILAVRFLRVLGVDTAGLATNLWWILFTTIPVLWAVIVYAYYELVVIEGGQGEQYAERENGE